VAGPSGDGGGTAMRMTNDSVSEDWSVIDEKRVLSFKNVTCINDQPD
jgi:hypothetical protein